MMPLKCLTTSALLTTASIVQIKTSDIKTTFGFHKQNQSIAFGDPPGWSHFSFDG